jgi:hypothetical protein
MITVQSLTKETQSDSIKPKQIRLHHNPFCAYDVTPNLSKNVKKCQREYNLPASGSVNPRTSNEQQQQRHHPAARHEYTVNKAFLAVSAKVRDRLHTPSSSTGTAGRQAIFYL